MVSPFHPFLLRPAQRCNSEYITNYYFYQDGSIEFEIRLTGILQVCVARDNAPDPYGINVAPNVKAQYHQHVFSIRVDPMIDGLNNSVIETDVVPLPDAPTGSDMNFAGNAFIAQETTLKRQSEGARDYDFEKDRRWRVVNPEKTHSHSGKEVGYTLGIKGAMVKMLARDDSWVTVRAPFGTKPLWVIKDIEGPKGGRVWPAGKYVPQTRTTPEDSVSRWAQGEGCIDNEDILLFITMGA